MEQVPSTKTSSHSQQVQLYNYKNCFGVLSIGSTTHYTSKKIFQPEFSQEWQGLEREHVTSILGCGSQMVKGRLNKLPKFKLRLANANGSSNNRKWRVRYTVGNLALAKLSLELRCWCTSH